MTANQRLLIWIACAVSLSGLPRSAAAQPPEPPVLAETELAGTELAGTESAETESAETSSRLVRIHSLGVQVAELYQAGRYAEAIPIADEWLSGIETWLGHNNSTVVFVLDTLVKLYEAEADYAATIPLLERALLIKEALLGVNHPDVAERRSNLLLLYADQGNYAAALPLLERTLTLPGLPDRSHLPGPRDVVSSFRGSHEAAEFSLYERAILIYKAVLQQDQLPLVTQLAELADAHISTHLQDRPDSAEAAELALIYTLRYKARVLEATASASRQLWQPPANQADLEELNNLRGLLEAIRINDIGDLPPEQYVRELSQLEERTVALSQMLTASQAEAFQIELEPVPIEAIQATLPAEAALVEIVRYRLFDADSFDGDSFDGDSAQDPWGASHYAAYILTQQGSVQAVDLGETDPIDRQVAAFQQALSTRSASVKAEARQLDTLLMAPVRSRLGNKTHLIISPDSQLNLIPFEALVDEQDRYLIETYQISYLTSGRDPLKFATHIPSQQPPVILANPDYDASTQPAAVSEPDQAVPAFGPPAFQPLPGTAVEANAIAPFLSNVTLFTQAAATETVLKQLEAPSILHIATHGFFSPPGQPAGSPSESPLLSSGLALAGANSGPGASDFGNDFGSNFASDSSQDDGILTALEAFGLNLQGTQLVVLSACDTGLGTTSDGEGVYGLRRALTAAGAESQVISLWQVDDYGTSELMRLYYKNLVQLGQGRSEALRSAQLELMNTRTYRHPYYWSAFIFSGDWQPLQRGSQ